MELTSSPSSNRPTVNDSTGVMNSSSIFSNHHDHDLPSPTITSPSHHQQYRMNFLSGASVASTSEDGHDDGEDEFAGEVKHILGAAVNRNTTIDASMQPQHCHQQQQHPPPISSVWAMNPHPSAGYANVVSSPGYSSASPPSSSYMPTSTSSYPHPPHQSHLQLHPPVQPQSHVYSHSQPLLASVTASASAHPSQSNIAMMQSQLEELQRQKALVEQQQQRMLQLQQMEQLQQQQQRALQMQQQQQQQQQRQHAHHPLHQQQQHHHQQHSPQHHVPNAPSPHYHPQPGYNFGGPNMNPATQHSSYNHSDPHHRASPFIQSPTSYGNGSGNSKPPAQSPMPSFPHHLSRPSSQLSASPIECSTPSRKRDRSGSFSQHHQRLPPALPLDRPSSAAAAYPMLDNRTGYEHRRMISEHSLTSSTAGVIYDPAEEERATHIKRCRSACGDVNAIRMPLTNAHAQHPPMQLSKLSNLPPMPMPHLSPSNVTPSPSSVNLPPATTTQIEPKRPQHRRRKTEELLPHETWLCPYTNTATGQGCGKMYRTSSSRSISKHVAQCRHRPADSPATDHLPPGQTNAMLGAEGLREGMTSRKRKQTKRRKSSELAAHERWNCPYGCGQFFRSTSTKSIHRHKAECDRRTTPKDPNAPHLTPDQLMQVEYARIEELRQKQLADGFTHARISSPPDTVHEQRPSGGDAARSSDEDESGDEYSQSSDDAGEHGSDSESAYSDEDKPADGVGDSHTKAMDFPPVRRRSFPDVFAESTLTVDPLSESIAKGEPLQINMSFAGLGADDFAAELSSAIAPRPAATITTPNLNSIEMSIKAEPTNEGDTDMNVTLSPMNGRPQIISSSSSSSVVGNSASANQLQHKLSELQRLQHQISQHQHHQPQHHPHPHPSQPNSNSTRDPSHPHPSQQHGQTNSPYGKSNEFDPSLMRPQQPNQQQQPYHSQQQQQVHGHLPDQCTDVTGLLDNVQIAGNEDTAALLRLLLQRQQHENQLLLQKSQLLQAQQQALSSSLSARELERPSSSASMRDLATDMSNLSWQNQQTAATKSVLQQQQQQQQHHHQHQQQAPMPPYASYANMNNSTNPYGSHPYEHGLTPHHRPASSLSNSNIANQSTPASTGPALDHHMAPTPTTTLSSPSATTMASRQSGSSSMPVPGLSSPQGQGGLGQGQGHSSSLISPHQPKKMMKSRRIGTQLPPHERWTCPLKCGKFYKKSSSNSIRRHSLLCLTALHAKSDPVTPVTSAELLQMIVGGVDRSKKKKKKEKAAQARAARQASQPKQMKTNSNDGVSHTNNRSDIDNNHDGSASYHPGPPSPSLSSECSESSESSTDYPLPPPPAPNAQLDVNSKSQSLFPSTISASSSSSASVPPLLLTPSDLLGLGSFDDEPDEDEFEYDENEDGLASEEEQQQETTDDAQLAALLDQ